MSLTEEQISDKLTEFREAVEAKYKDEFPRFDSRDVERFREDDLYAKCFIRSFWEDKHGLKDAIEHVDTVFTFRKEHTINDLTDEAFSELIERNFLYWKGVNNEDLDILHFKVVKHKKGSQVAAVKNYIAYELDKHQKKAPGKRMVLIFDFNGAGITNMDMDVVKYIIACFSKYFPSLLSYILLLNMPWLLGSCWKIIQTWLSSEQKKKIKLIETKHLPTYINEDQLKDMFESK